MVCEDLENVQCSRKKLLFNFLTGGFIFEYYFLRDICSNYGIFCGLQSFRKKLYFPDCRIVCGR